MKAGGREHCKPRMPLESYWIDIRFIKGQLDMRSYYSLGGIATAHKRVPTAHTLAMCSTGSGAEGLNNPAMEGWMSSAC